MRAFSNRKNLLLSLGLFLAIAATLPDRLSATNHITQIDEVMAGAFGRNDIQFVEMKFSDCSQNSWGNIARLVFFNASNVQVGQFIIPANPPSNCGLFGQSVLIGTQAYKDLTSAPDPDIIMPANLMPTNGKVCFKNIAGSGFDVALCLTYGNFTGATEQASTGNAPALPTTGICALQRNAFLTSFGAPNFNEDFVKLAPSPRNNAGGTGTVTVPPRFGDVPASNPFFPFVEAMFNNGISSGCGGGNFCPGNVVTRDQMAVFLLRAKLGASFSPPACTTQAFNDVPCSNPFAPWINNLAFRGITSGCGGGNYCPGNAVTRDQMAVFLLVTLLGSGFTPPACTTPVFSDVPCSNPFAPWINNLAARGITGGCGGGKFCPGNTVTREQMSVFLSTAFSLAVPTTGCP
jgi:hypothetical protein